MYNKILIANRGEIALRILRTCKKLKIKTVSVYSKIDKNLIHIRQSDEAICIGNNNPKDSYLNIQNIISAAEITNSNAIHPGYGFLSEDSNFAEQVNNSGINFIGPSANTIELMGNKLKAINLMKNNNIECLPSYLCSNDEKQNIKLANKIGYPIILKLINGGGGKGITIVNNDKYLNNSIYIIKKEASLSFKTNSIYMEKYIHNSRHIEIQILKDKKNNIVFLGERECSIQKNYQKIIEETPVYGIDYNSLDIIKRKCADVCMEINFFNTGTFEFLYKDKNFYFIEMNPRIQVEHTITEMVTNIDIIEKQIIISYYNTLDIKQTDININGHAIECRINIENTKKFIKDKCKIKVINKPDGPGVRFDSHIYNGYETPIYYDSLLGKLITHGKNRKEAIQKMTTSLNELIIDNTDNNISLLKNILNNKNYINNNIHINFIKELNSP